MTTLLCSMQVKMTVSCTVYGYYAMQYSMQVIMTVSYAAYDWNAMQYSMQVIMTESYAAYDWNAMQYAGDNDWKLHCMLLLCLGLVKQRKSNKRIFCKCWSYSGVSDEQFNKFSAS